MDHITNMSVIIGRQGVVERVEALREAFASPHQQEVRTLIDQYVSDGDVASLRAAAAAGIPAEAKGELFRESVLIGMLVLLDLDSRTPDAVAAVQDWFNVMKVTQIELQAMLPRATTYREVDRLISAGAHPNKAASAKLPVRNLIKTALEEARLNQRTTSANRMLEHLAVRGEIPLSYCSATTEQNPIPFFEKLLDAGTADAFSFSKSVLDILLHRGVPEQWQEHIGQVALSYAGSRGLRLEQTTERTELRTLALAKMKASGDWITLLSSCRSGPTWYADTLLAGQDIGGVRSKVVERMLEDGVHPDHIPARLVEDESYEGTLLQAAAYAGQTDMVRQLLQFGANPYLTLREGQGKYCGANTFEIAERRMRLETHTVLTSWKAREAIAGVLRRAHTPSRTET